MESAPDPTPSAAPTPEPRREVAPSGSVADRIAAAWPGNDAHALRVADCESGDYVAGPPYVPDPSAVSHTDDWGVFQINRPSWEGLVLSLGYQWSDMLRVEPNVEVAWVLRQDGGWAHWVASSGCHGLY